MKIGDKLTKEELESIEDFDINEQEERGKVIKSKTGKITENSQYGK